MLREDKRAIFSAAAHAQRAVDFLHGSAPAAEGGETPGAAGSAVAVTAAA